ncbi:MAG: hypothetical protein IJN90_03085 [Bacilli bacterium]|nr:hypothetical protein [Bacilli bacterium]
MQNIKPIEKKILIVMAIVFVGLIIFGLTREYKHDEETLVKEYEVFAIKDENRYLSITSAITTYINNVRAKNVDNLMVILDKKYVEENKINLSNVLDILEKYDTNYIVNIREIYQVMEFDDITIYYLKGRIMREIFESYEQEYIRDNYYKITINENTLAFAIAPLSKEEYISKVGDKDE